MLLHRGGIIPALVVMVSALTAWGPRAAEDEGMGWPREILVPEGRIVVYQPQIESFAGDSLTGRAAVSVTPKGREEPVFGAIWFNAYVTTDRESRTVRIVELRVPRVRFPEATEQQQERLKGILELEVPYWDLEISLDRLLTGIELAEHERAISENLKTDPPKVLFTTEPAILVTLDGEPVLHDVDESELKRVVNTPFIIVLDPATSAYYLYAGQEIWFTASDVTGPWAVSERTPEAVATLIPPDSAQAEAGSEEDFDVARVMILVATEPTELIIADGPPEYASIGGTSLLYIANTERDVFLDIESQKFFIVLAGRWYSAESLDQPLTYVPSDSLPADFARIPPDSDRGSVLTYVAGTDQARDAVLDNSIPQTSAVKLDGTIEVTYDGEPRFEPIEGTEMRYAVNTEYQVLEIDGRYYVSYEAVWYESDGPQGSFTVSTAIPDDVQQIPPDNPNYNVKYVYIYDYTPEVVYVGYTPGYTWSYVYGPTIVYGTGWYYRPWVSPYYYYPRPVTWGFRVSYNPWYGWSFGFGYNYGPFHFGFATGPSYGYRPGGWWGPGGYRHGYYHGYQRGYGSGYRRGYRAGYAAGNRQSNIYNRQRNATRNVDRATARSQLSQRQGRPATGNVQAGQRPGGATTRDRQPAASQGRENNLYTDKSGNVYRRNQDGSWQMRDQQNWKNADRSALEGRGQGADRARDANRTREANRQGQAQTRQGQAATRQSPTTGSSTQNRSGNLNREYQNRQRGASRTQSYGRSRSGGARSGGGRRR